MKKWLFFIFILTSYLTITSPHSICMDLLLVEEEENSQATQPVSEEENSEASELGNPLLIKYMHIFATAQNKGKRRYMEDYHYNNSTLGFHGIYDGHGSDIASLLASKKIHDFLFKNEVYTPQPYQAILSSFQKFNEQYKQCDDCGTTATIVLFTDKSFIIANAGDSDAVCSIKGKAKCITQTHNPDAPIEKVRLSLLSKEHHTPATYLHKFDNPVKHSFIEQWQNNKAIIKELSIDHLVRLHKNGLAVSRSLGDLNCAPYLISDPFIQEIELSKDHEFIIMASDGLWDAISYQAAVDFVREKMNELSVTSSTVSSEEAQQIATELMQTAMKTYTSDNITVTIIFLNSLDKN